MKTRFYSPTAIAFSATSNAYSRIVKHMINLQGGEVGVDCPPEGGSVFWVQMQAA